MTDPDSPWWLRPLAIWEGDPPRNRLERVAYVGLLVLVFAPIPLGFAFAGGLVGPWCALAGFLFGALQVACLLCRIQGPSCIELGCFLALFYLFFLLVLIPALLYVRGAARRLREQEADRGPSASVQSPPATDRRRSPHRTSPLAPWPRT